MRSLGLLCRLAGFPFSLLSLHLWQCCCHGLQVDDSGKVQRLRKQCPSEQCGEGIFMATHFNRVYWWVPAALCRAVLHACCDCLLYCQPFALSV